MERILQLYVLALWECEVLWGLWLSTFTWASPCGGGIEGTCVATLSEALAHSPSTGEPLETSVRPTGSMGEVYDANAYRVSEMQPSLRATQADDLEAFYAHYKKNRMRYESVAREVDLPPALIAALHWRESTGNFGTYMHQGDPLGEPARHHPRNIPVFDIWEPSAVHAFNTQGWIQQGLGITRSTTDLAALATYAEYYNGLGYSDRGVASPYVFSGTDQYSRGKYVSDGRYSRSTRDRQLGVALMIQTIMDREPVTVEV